jgi:hypothetical protein
MSGIYNHPEAHGLRVVGQVDWGESSGYGFNLTVVWSDVVTGELYVASDTGCSCPQPFELENRATLTLIPADQPQVLTNHLNDWLSHTRYRRGWWCEADEARTTGELGELTFKVTALCAALRAGSRTVSESEGDE